MLALLPLRMWAADGMAMRMAGAGLANASVSAQAGHGMASMDMSSMPEDCPMMAGKGESKTHGHQPPGDESGPSGHATCLTCQLCAALATTFEPSLARHAPPTAKPLAALDRFASAEPRRESKPPIS